VPPRPAAGLRHAPGDRAIGQPLWPDCYDYAARVVWNNQAGELWRRTKQAAERHLNATARRRGLPPLPASGAAGARQGRRVPGTRRGPLPRPAAHGRHRPGRPRRHHRAPGRAHRAAITLASVRRWRKKLLDAGVSPVTSAKAYRLLRAILNTAVEDGLIRTNPCRIKGAGSEDSPERPVLSVAPVYALATPSHCATRRSCSWPPSQASGGRNLPRSACEIVIDACTVRVTRQISHPRGGGHSFGSPKSRAGRRVVAFHDLILPDLRRHLAALNADDLVFTSPEGSPLRHSNFYRRDWTPALAAVSLNGVHFHDLRHTGNQFSVEAGANLRELMARMGHDSTRAASLYLHSSDNVSGR
jgi:integrase